MNFVNDLLKKNPKLLTKYVTLGFNLVDKTVGPLNKLMVHLLEVQGIDPKTQPGARAREALVKAIDQVKDMEDFDVDFNFAPAFKAFDKLKHLNLTKEQFKKVTDLSNLTDVEPLKVTKKWNSETQTTDDYDNHINDLQKFMDKYNISLTEIPLNTNSVKVALSVLKKYIDKSTPSERVEDHRSPVAVGHVKRSSQPVAITKTFKKGVFRRTTKSEE